MTAFLMSSMMADVINAGTAARARGLGFTLPAAGKTGTTNEYHDAWFVGFTPSLVAGVWVGLDQPQTILPGGFASDVAVPLWTSFMKEATKGQKPAWLPVPAGVTSAQVCRLTGRLAVESATATAGTSPDEPPAAPKEEPKKKKRGFWSRVFGIGGGDRDRDEEGGETRKDRQR